MPPDISDSAPPASAGKQAVRTVDWSGLFGYDVFISYKRTDATGFAAATAQALHERNYTCFLDKSDAPPGVPLDEHIRAALRKSRALLVIVTPGALDSPWVTDECRLFLPRARPIIPVDVDGLFARLPVDDTTWGTLRRLNPIRVDAMPSDVVAARPTDALIDQVAHLFIYTKANTLRRIVIMAVVAILAVAAIVAATAAVRERRARAAAVLSEVGERRAHVEADEARQRADDNRQAAERQRDIARARDLAANGALQAERDPDLSLRLFDESLRLADTRQGANLVQDFLYERPMELALRNERGYRDVDFSLDGRSLVTTTGDGVVRVWDREAGQLSRVITARKGFFNDARYSADGQFILTAGSDGVARLWRADTGAPLQIYGPHDDAVVFAAFSRDGRFIVTTSGFAAYIWRVGTGERIHTLDHSVCFVTHAAFSPDGASVVTTCSNNTVQIWDAATGSLTRELTRETYSVSSASYSPDGRFILTANTLWAGIWDARTGEKLRTLTHRDQVTSAVYSPDGRFILTASERTATIWDAETGKSLRELRGYARAAGRAVYSRDGRAVATTGDSVLRVWNVAPDGRVRTLTDDSLVHFSAAFGPDGQRLLTQSTLPALWNVATGQLIRYFQRRTDSDMDGYNSATFSPDGRRILTTIRGNIRIWNAETGALARQQNVHALDAVSATYSRSGRLLVTGSLDHTARVWNAVTGTLVVELKGHRGTVNRASFDPTEAFVVTASDDKTVRIWNATTGDQIRELIGHAMEVDGAAFSPDGRFVATASRDRSARVWDSGTGAMVHELKGHGGPVTDVGYSADGHLIVTTCADGVARVYYASSGELLRELVVASDLGASIVSSAAFSPDGQSMVTATREGFRIWPRVLFATRDNLLARLRRMRPRELTQDERDQFLAAGPSPTLDGTHP